MPSRSPTSNPTADPTPAPVNPTPSPTSSPTPYPTVMPTPEPTPRPTGSPTPFPTPYPTPTPTYAPTMPPTKDPTPAPDLCGPYDGMQDDCNNRGADTADNCFYKTWGSPSEVGRCLDCGECASDMTQPACLACVLKMNFYEYCLSAGWSYGCPGDAPTTAPTDRDVTAAPTNFPCSGWTGEDFLCDIDPQCYVYEPKYMYWGFGLAEGECVDCATCIDYTVASCVACALQQPKSTYCTASPSAHGCGGPTQTPTSPPSEPPTEMPTLVQNCDTYPDRTSCISAGCAFEFNRCYDGVTFPCATSTLASCDANPQCKLSLFNSCVDVDAPDSFSCDEISAVPVSGSFSKKDKKIVCRRSVDAQGNACLFDNVDSTCIDPATSVCADWSRQDCVKAHKKAPAPSDGPCTYGLESQMCLPWQQTKCKKLAEDGPIGDAEQDCLALVSQGCKARYNSNGFRKCTGKLRI